MEYFFFIEQISKVLFNVIEKYNLNIISSLKQKGSQRKVTESRFFVIASVVCTRIIQTAKYLFKLNKNGNKFNNS